MKTEDEFKEETIETVGNVYNQIYETLCRASSDIGASMAQLARTVNEFTEMYTQTVNKICCNNWRRFHKLPTIRRKHERRH